MFKLNKNVTIYFNNTTASGKLLEWKDYVKLQLADKSILTILDVNYIVAVKEAFSEEELNEVKKTFNEVKEEPPSPKRDSTLIDLKLQLIDQEKLIVSEKLRDHTAGSIGVKYEFPRITKK